MLYNLTQGKTEQSIIRQCIKDGRPYPAAIRDAPDLRSIMGLEVFMQAFYDLSTCRGGMGGPIPWTDIQAYCNEMGYEGDFREKLFHHVRELDFAFLEHHEQQRRQEP